MKVQAHLLLSGESLQIPYPKGFNPRSKIAAERSDPEFHLTTTPRWLSPDEIELAEKFIDDLPYQQKLVKTGAVLIDANDPLLTKTHDELDGVERQLQLGNTRRGPTGSPRNIRERVILIRERNYLGNGSLALTAG